MVVDDQSNEWHVRVAHAFESHVREEAAILDAYERLIASTDDQGVRHLLRLILRDERHHHDQFEQLAAAARDQDDATTQLPDVARSNHNTELARETQRFLALERDDAASLKRLSRDLRPARDRTLWSLLVELMRLDTEKHVRILKYLGQHLGPGG